MTPIDLVATWNMGSSLEFGSIGVSDCLLSNADSISKTYFFYQDFFLGSCYLN